MPHATTNHTGAHTLTSNTPYSKTHDIKLSTQETSIEEKRREEEEYIHTYIHTQPTNQQDCKVHKTVSVSRLLWDSVGAYAFHSELTVSGLVERALMEYMFRHAVELPVSVTFNVVASEPKTVTCDMADCAEAGVAKGLFLPLKKEKWLCLKHYREAKDQPKRWKVLEEP